MLEQYLKNITSTILLGLSCGYSGIALSSSSDFEYTKLATLDTYEQNRVDLIKAQYEKEHLQEKKVREGRANKRTIERQARLRQQRAKAKNTRENIQERRDLAQEVAMQKRIAARQERMELRRQKRAEKKAELLTKKTQRREERQAKKEQRKKVLLENRAESKEEKKIRRQKKIAEIQAKRKHRMQKLAEKRREEIAKKQKLEDDKIRQRETKRKELQIKIESKARTNRKQARIGHRHVAESLNDYYDRVEVSKYDNQRSEESYLAKKRRTTKLKSKQKDLSIGSTTADKPFVSQQARIDARNARIAQARKELLAKSKKVKEEKLKVIENKINQSTPQKIADNKLNSQPQVSQTKLNPSSNNVAKKAKYSKLDQELVDLSSAKREESWLTKQKAAIQQRVSMLKAKRKNTKVNSNKAKLDNKLVEKQYNQLNSRTSKVANSRVSNQPQVNANSQKVELVKSAPQSSTMDKKPKKIKFKQDLVDLKSNKREDDWVAKQRAIIDQRVSASNPKIGQGYKVQKNTIAENVRLQRNKKPNVTTMSLHDNNQAKSLSRAKAKVANATRTSEMKNQEKSWVEQQHQKIKNRIDSKRKVVTYTEKTPNISLVVVDPKEAGSNKKINDIKEQKLKQNIKAKKHDKFNNLSSRTIKNREYIDSDPAASKRESSWLLKQKQKIKHRLEARRYKKQQKQRIAENRNNNIEEVSTISNQVNAKYDGTDEELEKVS